MIIKEVDNNTSRHKTLYTILSTDHVQCSPDILCISVSDEQGASVRRHVSMVENTRAKVNLLKGKLNDWFSSTAPQEDW